MVIIRVGEGRSPSGKILDRDTRWFKEINAAMEYHLLTGKKIYISKDNKKYVEVSKSTLKFL